MEFKKNTISLIIWTVVITFFIVITMAIYPTFMENQSKILGMMSLVPKGALQFKGVSDFNDLLSPLGFYAANNVIYMMVLGSIFSIVFSSNILLKEEYNKTAEYLLTRPVTRNEIFITKMTVVFCHIFILNLVTSLAGYISVELVANTPVSIRTYLILCFYTLLLNILFATVGFFISSTTKRAKPVTTFSIGMVLFFYFIYTLSRITEGASKVGYISPFRYVRMDAINPSYRLEIWHLIYFTGISLLLLWISYRMYRRKDIYT
jgi:ABC-2 type transport system permease protein